MRRTAQRVAMLCVLLCSCQRAPTLETLVDAMVAGGLRDPATARKAIALASTHELVTVRRGLVDALLLLDGVEFAAELRRAVVDAHPMVRLQAARAFERWGTAEDLAALDQAAEIVEEGPTPESAGATAANAALRIRLAANPEPAQRALADLQSDVPQVRVSGAVNLGYYRWPPSIAPLQHAVLNETDELARAMAACALASFDAAAVAPVFDRVVALLRAQPMISRRCAVKAISMSDHPDAARLLLQAITEGDPLTRRWVVQGLQRMKPTQHQKAILFLSARHDTDPAVRAEAVQALVPMAAPDVEKVWRLATTDPAARVRAAGAHALVRTGADDVVATALQDQAWEVRAAVLIGLTRRTASSDAGR